MPLTDLVFYQAKNLLMQYVLWIISWAGLEHLETLHVQIQHIKHITTADKIINTSSFYSGNVTTFTTSPILLI